MLFSKLCLSSGSIAFIGGAYQQANRDAEADFTLKFNFFPFCISLGCC